MSLIRTLNEGDDHDHHESSLGLILIGVSVSVLLIVFFLLYIFKRDESMSFCTTRLCCCCCGGGGGSNNNRHDTDYYDVEEEDMNHHPPPPHHMQASQNQDIALMHQQMKQLQHGGVEQEKQVKKVETKSDDVNLSEWFIPPKQLHYVRKLASGSFGEVWIGQFKSFPVAIKKILSKTKKEQSLIQQFVEEIKVMSRLQHPQIVRFIGASWSDLSDVSCVTEYVPQGDLYDFLLKHKDSLTWPKQKLPLALDLISGLAYLHSLTPVLIHRDLKTRNVLIDAEQRAKITDFGLSRARSVDQTMTAGIGTLLWMAPEIVCGEKYTELADVYSFGIILAEMDTCAIPYVNYIVDKKVSKMQLLSLIAKKNLRPSFSPTCPAFIRDLAENCLQRDPSLRMSSKDIEALLRQKYLTQE